MQREKYKNKKEDQTNARPKPSRANSESSEPSPFCAQTWAPKGLTPVAVARVAHCCARGLHTSWAGVPWPALVPPWGLSEASASPQSPVHHPSGPAGREPTPTPAWPLALLRNLGGPPLSPAPASCRRSTMWRVPRSAASVGSAGLPGAQLQDLGAACWPNGVPLGLGTPGALVSTSLEAGCIPTSEPVLAEPG